MTNKHEKGWEKPTVSEVATLKDDEILIEKKLPNVTKLDLTSLDQRQSMKALNDSHNRLLEEVTLLKIMILNTSEYLASWRREYQYDFEKIDSALERIEKLQSRVTLKCGKCRHTVPPESQGPLENDPPGIVPAWKHSAEIRKKRTLDKIKKIQKLHPELAKNPKIISALAGLSINTVRNHMKAGLV